jgi:uncharacterized membrane protein
MKTTYNHLAGQSVERLAALSDGIFGVAMTLLLLELQVPDAKSIHSETDLWRALAALSPELLVYLMSFITLGIFWVGQQTQLNHLTRSDRHLTWIHLGFLFTVTILPFSTKLLIEFTHYRAALLTYWFNIFALGGMLYFCWARATRTGLVDDDLTEEAKSAICRRMIYAQSLYAFGAALCVFSTYASIGFIVLVQLYYALAPTFGRGKPDAEESR